MRIRIVHLIALASVYLCALSSVGAAPTPPLSALTERAFPSANRIAAFAGEPRAANVYKDKLLLGYLFQTIDIAPIPAYSGKPVNVLVAMDTQGKITGTQILEHHEPILLTGIPEQRLQQFADQYVGRSVQERVKVGAGQRKGYLNIDAITGATVTVIVVNRSIMQAARALGAARGIIKSKAYAPSAAAHLRLDAYEPASWPSLINEGAVGSLQLTTAQVEQAFTDTQAQGQDQQQGICVEDVQGEHCDVFIDLHEAYLNVAHIGRNLLGDTQYQALMARLAPGEHAIAVMANGAYSFKGSAYVRGGIFDRIQLVQEDITYSFRDKDYQRLNDVYAQDIPHFHEMGIFTLRTPNHFDPARPWQIELLVRRQIGPLKSLFTSFSGDYTLPQHLIEKPAAQRATPPEVVYDDEEPMWVALWRERRLQISVLILALIVLSAILLFQDNLARHARLLQRVRTGFLLFTVIFIGWHLLGQLSVINVLTFISAVLGEFSWQSFLIDPTLFILWSFVAVTLLLWGRGVYCGWLCPFGALQTLINDTARALHVPQWNLPHVVHERMWALKYIIFLLLFALSLQSMSLAEHYAEVEPFKTAVALHFEREWGYVFYAAGLLLISVVNGKFYCKYLCPLGAALAIPARLRIFDWLRRRKECARPCQICAHECEIQAIDDIGQINANECHYCLDCQVNYYDAHTCPPLIEKRKRREKASALSSRGTRAKKIIPIIEHNKTSPREQSE